MPKKCRHLLQTSDLSLDEIKLLLEKASVYANDFNAVSLETKEKCTIKSSWLYFLKIPPERCLVLKSQA